MKFMPTFERTWKVVPLVLVMGVALAHARQIGGAGNSAPMPNPCSLLSSAEIGAASGETVNEGVILFPHGATAGCSFVRIGGGRIAVFIRRPATGEWAAEQVGRMRRGVSLGTYREVDGVGDRAFLLKSKGSVTVLCVFQGPYYLQISVFGAAVKHQKREAVEELARAALRRLAPVTAKKRVIAVRRTVALLQSRPLSH